MKLEHYSLEKLKKEIIGVMAKHLDLQKTRVFFFGSRVDKSASERSDIDIGIEGIEPVPFDTLMKIKEEIQQIPTLYKMDVVDFRQVSEDFREVALQAIEIISDEEQRK